MSRSLGVGLVAVLVLSISVARGDDTAAIGDDLRAEAQAHYDRGKRFFGDGDFVAAAVEFRQAELLLAPVAVNPDGTIKNKDAHELRRLAISNEATSYSQANLPVEAVDAFVLLIEQFSIDLPAARVKEVEEAIAKLRERIGTVELRGLPRDAAARIDGRAVPPEAGLKPFRIAAGEHVLLAEGKPYKPFEKHFTVVAGAPVAVDVAMVASDAPARVRIESTIEPAEISIDGTKRGPSPVELEIKPGDHRYEVTSEQYHSAEGTFTAAPGERSVVKVTLIPRRNPLGFRIESYFGGYIMNRGDTPLGKFDLGVGLRLFHTAVRFAGLELGLDFAGYTRDIDRFSIGPVMQWCPDIFKYGRTRDQNGQWCPINIATLKTTGGSVGAFTSGENAFRLSTGIEQRFNPIVFRFAGGIGTESYKRSALVDLSVGVTYVEVSVGFDL